MKLKIHPSTWSSGGTVETEKRSLRESKNPGFGSPVLTLSNTSSSNPTTRPCWRMYLELHLIATLISFNIQHNSILHFFLSSKYLIFFTTFSIFIYDDLSFPVIARTMIPGLSNSPVFFSWVNSETEEPKLVCDFCNIFSLSPNVTS